MIRRSHFLSLLVFGSIALPTNAFAHFQIPATAGLPGSSLYENPPFPAPQHWTWFSDVYVRRPNSTTTPSWLEWMIPLVFHQSLMTANIWTAQVMVSAGTTCSLVWKPDDLPGIGGATTNAAYATVNGLLDLTGPGSCPTGGPADGCITVYASAYVSCTVGRGGYVGPVIYSITAYP
jgi:hypothetical protein